MDHHDIPMQDGGFCGSCMFGDAAEAAHLMYLSQFLMLPSSDQREKLEHADRGSNPTHRPSINRSLFGHVYEGSGQALDVLSELNQSVNSLQQEEPFSHDQDQDQDQDLQNQKMQHQHFDLPHHEGHHHHHVQHNHQGQQYRQQLPQHQTLELREQPPSPLPHQQHSEQQKQQRQQKRQQQQQQQQQNNNNNSSNNN
ncbi:LOW QUALITY PROTEIN: putative cyclin-dependent serine/threonine-protein kinase DDB_G0272797/DDB_G0274007, partial [Varroa destructor]|uniref:Uncharacterized protein n=1 Tax=Varroa destructor TaxID=109461 RepID=A0A7M7L2M2_VARDE